MIKIIIIITIVIEEGRVIKKKRTSGMQTKPRSFCMSKTSQAMPNINPPAYMCPLIAAIVLIITITITTMIIILLLSFPQIILRKKQTGRGK